MEEMVLTYDPETGTVQVASDGLSTRGLLAMTDGVIQTICGKLEMERDQVLENFMGLVNE